MTKRVAVVIAVSLLVAVSTFALTTQQKRLVVPVAGSLTAFDGSQFKTSLRLTLQQGQSGTYTGRIIFHPQGQKITDDDPSITYSLTGDNQTAHSMYWDDVVAAIGQSGLGTIDIVPDGDSVPLVEARVYNIKEDRIYGDSVPVLKGTDVFTSTPIAQFTVYDREHSRTNVGIRTFGTIDQIVDVYAIGANGTFRHSLRTFPANTFTQLSVDDLLGQPVLEGETIRIISRIAFNLDAGMFVYYTKTENSTNDPTVVAPLQNQPTKLE